MTVSLVEPADGHVIALAGAVDPGAVIGLYRAVSAARDDGHLRIVIDLRAVTILGGQTAGLLCGAIRQLAHRGVTLEVLGAPAHIQRALDDPATADRSADHQRELRADVGAAAGDHLATGARAA